MEKLEKEYRKWGTIALCCVMSLLFSIAAIDSFLDFDFSKNMYVMSIVATSCLLAIISMSWIRLLNCKLMRINLVNTDKAEPNAITLADVEMCIRKEGYVPQVEEDRVMFKIAGERYDVYYQDDKFTLIKRFTLADDVNKELLLKACAQAHNEIFMFRSYTHTLVNSTTLLCFEVETYVTSLAELEKFFPQYLNVINHAIVRQKEIYHQMIENNNSMQVDSIQADAKEHKVVS